MNTLETLQKLIAAQMGLEPSEITPDRTWDSLGMNAGTVAFLFSNRVQDAFGKAPTLADLVTIQTVGDLLNWLEAS